MYRITCIVAVLAISTATASAAIYSEDFESGDANDWSEWLDNDGFAVVDSPSSEAATARDNVNASWPGSVALPADAADGTYFLQLDKAGGDFGFFKTLAIPVSGFGEGDTLTVSVDLWAFDEDLDSGGGSLSGTLDLRMYGLSSDAIGSGDGKPSDNEVFFARTGNDYGVEYRDGNWGNESLSHTLTADEAGQLTHVSLVFRLKGKDHAYYGFDNIELTPEPASLALLGAGGLMLVRRRRR